VEVEHLGHRRIPLLVQRDVLRGEVGDEVAERVHVEDGSFPGLRPDLLGLGNVQHQRVGDGFTELGGLHALAQPAGYGREHVPAVEGAAQRLLEEVLLGDAEDAVHLLAGEDVAQHAVVGGQEKVILDGDQQGAPLAAHLRVHHHDVDAPVREEPEGAAQHEGGLQDVARRDGVGDIHHVDFRVDPEDGSLHRSGERAGETEIGDQRHAPTRHGRLLWVLPAPVIADRGVVGDADYPAATRAAGIAVYVRITRDRSSRAQFQSS